MKFGKDEFKKLFLSVLMLLGLLYVYFTMLLGPLNTTQTRAKAETAAFKPKIAAAEQQIKRTAEAEERAVKAEQVLTQITSMIPEGAPVAWFPPRMTDFFKRHGIDRATTRLNSEAPEKDLPGYRRLSWTIELPQVEFLPLGAAIAALENEEPLLEIINLQVDAIETDPRYQRAVLTVSTLVK